MRKLSIRTVLMVLSALTLLLGLGEAFIAVTQIGRVAQGGHDMYGDIIPSISLANNINTSFGDVRIFEAEHLMLDEPRYQPPIEAAIGKSWDKIGALTAQYARLIAPDASAERQIFLEVSEGIKAYRAHDETYLSLSRRHDTAPVGSAEALYRGPMKAVYDRTGELLDKLIAINQADATKADTANNAAVSVALLSVELISVGLLTAALVSTVFAFYGVSRPLARISEAMRALSDGRTETVVPFVRNANELGTMARAIQVFKENLIRTAQLEAETAHARADADVQRKATMRAMAERFEDTVGGILTKVSASAQRLQNTARSMTEVANATATQSTLGATAAEQAGTNVTTVASAAEELEASVAEIGRQVDGSSRLAAEAVAEADQTATLVRNLQEAAGRIGATVGMISTVADRTNLLALNATIEAARAGQAGRGFAVVATEVKELAAQTGRATEEIRHLVAAIQNSTVTSVTAIGGIAQRIREISSVATSIAAAVEQQGAATREIVRNVAEAAIGTGEVSTIITGVAQSADTTGAAATEVLVSASDLRQQAAGLANEVEHFLMTVRAA